MSLKPKNIQVEKVPENNGAEAWTIFNQKINELANQGYTVSFTTEKYIVLTKKTASTRREE
jgi:broad-specificity NMP kinase